MSQYKCGKCGREYTFEEQRTLKYIPVKPDDPNPKKNYGYTPVCSCGYVFGNDKWRIRDTLELKTDQLGLLKIDVSTVFLELNHGFGGVPLWYETMCFAEGSVRCDFQDRYTTKEEAEKGHEKIKNALLEGFFTLEPTEWTISLHTLGED